MPLGGPHKVYMLCVCACVCAGWFSSAANINTRLFMPAKIETLKCNAAIFGRTICGRRHSSQFAQCLPFLFFSYLVLYCVFFFFIVYFFFCFFDWRSVCFAKSQTPWVVAEPLSASQRSRTCCRARQCEVMSAAGRRPRVARCEPHWQKHWTCQTANTVATLSATRWGRDTRTRQKRKNENECQLCFSRIFRTGAVLKRIILFVSYIPCILKSISNHEKL